MVHARLPPPVADRLIERIARRLPAEQVAIGRAETLDRCFVEQGFGRREQLQRLGGAQAALVGRIEAANALDRKSAGWGTSVSVSVDLCGRRNIKKKKIVS